MTQIRFVRFAKNSELGFTDRAVYSVVFSATARDKEVSASFIAETLGSNRATIKKALGKLFAAGLVSDTNGRYRALDHATIRKTRSGFAAYFQVDVEVGVMPLSAQVLYGWLVSLSQWTDCRTNRGAIAAVIGVTTSTIDRSLASLVALGRIEVKTSMAGVSFKILEKSVETAPPLKLSTVEPLTGWNGKFFGDLVAAGLQVELARNYVKLTEIDHPNGLNTLLPVKRAERLIEEAKREHNRGDGKWGHLFHWKCGQELERLGRVKWAEKWRSWKNTKSSSGDCNKQSAG